MPVATAEIIWTRKHLLGLEDLTRSELVYLLRTARNFEPVSTLSARKSQVLQGKVVANLFFESSTRTKSSFFLAAQRLGADVLDFTASVSSTNKGETLRDTVRNIEAMGVDMIVCRHSASGSAKLVAESVCCPVINAGDGQHEHPTQGLLDVYTVHQLMGVDRAAVREEFDLSGITVAIVGDIAHSRVARSNIHALKKLGATVLLVGPPTLLPASLAGLGCEIHNDFDAVLPRLDVVNMLRVQFERLTSAAFPSTREYSAMYGLTKQRLARMKKTVLVMHPGPINRGLEIASDVADCANSSILRQVTNGLAVRMACMALLLSPKR